MEVNSKKIDRKNKNKKFRSFDLLWEEMKKEVGDLAQYHADFSAQISSEAELIENYFSTDHQWTQFQTVFIYFIYKFRIYFF